MKCAALDPKEEPKRKAVVLLSGGLDSATTLAIAQAQGFEAVSLCFDYGQRHSVELQAAKRVATWAGVPMKVISFDLRQFGGSALTSETPVPKERSSQQMSAEIPATYVPARNMVFLSFALGLAETIGALDIFIGVNAVDYSGYPDCRPEFIVAFEQLARIATRAGVEGQKIKIHAPLLRLSKSEIIREGTRLGVDYSLTHSCYDPDESGAACGACDSCVLRRRGFEEAGVKDPTRYANT